MNVSYPGPSTPELEPLLTNILEQLSSVVDYTGATFLQREGDELVVLAHRGPISREDAKKIRFPFAKTASRAVVANRQPIIIPDVDADTPLARAYRRSAGEAVRPLLSYVQSWMAVPLIVKDQVIGILSLDHEEAHYYTPQHAELAQVFANQVAVFVENAQLYAETRKRADEIQALFAVQQAITRRLDPDDVLQMIADEARRLTNTEMSAVYLLTDEQLEVAVVSGNVTEELRGYLLPISGSVAGLAVTHGRPYLVTDTEADPAVNRTLSERVGARSFVTVPLLFEEKAIGAITVANKEAGTLGPEDERVLAMLASGAVIALQNARLFARLEQRTQELEALYRADEELYSHLQLQDVLDALVKVATDILGADKSSLMVWNEKRTRLIVRAQRGFQPETVAKMSFGPDEGVVGRTARSGELTIVEDVAKENGVVSRITEAEGIRSFMHVPIRIGGRVFGVFNASYEAPRAFGEEEKRLFMALAQRAALVIENARLYERAQQAAAAEERNRLARELHDAVTQALFSASLIADVLPRLWEKDEEQGRQRLAELKELTRGALAEMRTLLMELRPATLTEVGMGELLRQLADALAGRSRLPIELNLDCDRELPPDVRVALYRIAQESLNNTIKHAGASRVMIDLSCTDEEARLSIADDGRGFDVDKASYNTLGLRIMRERAEGIDATLAIDSGAGAGTKVTVVWPDKESDEE